MFVEKFVEKEIYHLHCKAQSLAFACYIRKGHVPPRLLRMVAATASVEAFHKYNPDQPRVPAGNGRESGEWTSGGDGGDTNTVDDPPIQPVYPIETVLTAILGGSLGMLGDGIGAVGEGASALADGAGAAAEDAASALSDAADTVAQDVSAVTQRLTDILMPDGEPIGDPGSRPDIRELPGGDESAQNMFDQLSEGGTPYQGKYSGTGYDMPDGSFIGYRSPDQSKSDAPTIDINVPNIVIRKLKFPAGD